MANVKGVVEGVSKKEGQRGTYFYGYKVNDAWYNVTSKSATAEFSKGDTIEFMYELDPKGDRVYNKVTKARKLAASQAQAAPASGTSRNFAQGSTSEKDRQASIVRQNSLAHATAVVVATTKSKNADEVAKEVIRIAKTFFYPFAMEGTLPQAAKPQVEEADAGTPWADEDAEATSEGDDNW
jgi:hypothetical protein